MTIPRIIVSTRFTGKRPSSFASIPSAPKKGHSEIETKPNAPYGMLSASTSGQAAKKNPP
jgi:hypothetical protein